MSYLERVRLTAILCAIAVAAFAIRFAAMTQAFATVGAPVQWGQIGGIELANAAAWSLWAFALTKLAEHFLGTEEPRGLGRKFGFAMIAVLMPAILMPALLSPVHVALFQTEATLGAAFKHVFGHNVPFHVLLALTMYGVASGTMRTRREQALRARADRLGAELSKAQLEALRSQLDPHFLFNALNSIAVLARRGQPDEVERMIGHLSALLRHSLDAGRAQLVPLRVELEALQHFVDIELVRRGDRLRVTFDTTGTPPDTLVPSLILQPLVENAIKHGADATSVLHVGVAARVDGARLTICVTDDGVGLQGEPADGVGLGNTRARLAGLWGDRASLSLRAAADGRGAVAEVVMPVGAA
jgi:two-component system LytT family sensor kinase